MQGRGVVDPVAGHGHHLAAGLQGLHQPQFLRGRDAGADVDGLEALAQRGIVQLAELIAREHL